MGNVSTQKFTLVRFCVPLLLVVTFCYATSALATTQALGSEVNVAGKLVKEELAKTNLKVQDDEKAKSKGFFDQKPIFKWPFIKPIHPQPVIKRNPFPVHKPAPKGYRRPRVKKNLFSPPPPRY
ncbi:hypothetical protein TanjilG_19952 [Lupinus angustifolius]|uniref:Uncharacterized protein n=1 Tax=Lupinus angustifolius TaxID=3871 RepID=A0A4P1RBR2_LUPAN|nr:PREDICTED: uncharacterized protein LOC109352643 [Lupinus angustifolius]OIW07851.1 hypothetical protein TanjilG_19952 [Lupinus angustifolius]